MPRLPGFESQVAPASGGVAPGSNWLPQVDTNTGLAHQFDKLGAEGQQIETIFGQVQAQQIKTQDKISMLNFAGAKVKADADYMIKAQTSSPFTSPVEHMSQIDQMDQAIIAGVPEHLQPLAVAHAQEMSARLYGQVMENQLKRQQSATVGAAESYVNDLMTTMQGKSEADRQEMVNTVTKQFAADGPLANTMAPERLDALRINAVNNLTVASKLATIQNPADKNMNPAQMYAYSSTPEFRAGLTPEGAIKVQNAAHAEMVKYQEKNAADVNNSTLDFLSSNKTRDPAFGAGLADKVKVMAQNGDLAPGATDKFLAVARAAQFGTTGMKDGPSFRALQPQVLDPDNPLNRAKFIQDFNDGKYPDMAPSDFVNLVDRLDRRDKKDFTTLEQTEAHTLGKFSKIFDKATNEDFLYQWQQFTSAKDSPAKQGWPGGPQQIQDSINMIAEPFIKKVGIVRQMSIGAGRGMVNRNENPPAPKPSAFQMFNWNR